MENLILEYKQALRNKSLEKLLNAFRNCKPEILYSEKKYTKVLIPEYLYNYITEDEYLEFSGYNIQLGYEDAIVIFDTRNPFINGYIYRYELKSKWI